jgi:Pacifastin inhibitor (LCMII)
MLFKNGCLAISLCAALATFAVGCGDASQPEEQVGTERQMLSDSIPWWLVEMPADWGCGQTIDGRFQGWDSAHMYRFPGKVGYTYDFSFKGEYPAYKGIVMGVYDTETGALVATDHDRWGNEIALQYEAEKSIDYLVAVYSVNWRATGDYTLTAECELSKFCVEWETTDDDGTPYNNYYAQDVTTYDEGKQVLTHVGPFINETINPGACADQGVFCPAIAAPVCSDTPALQTQYGNLCEFKRHVREMSTLNGQWKGHWEDGPCDATDQFCGGFAGLPCPDGFMCVLQGSYPDAGGTCQPVGCNYEGTDYAPGESFPSSDGCNTCSCMDNGGVACTKKACSCNATEGVEWWHHYITSDQNMCASIHFTCAENTFPFSNGCGCGCEQSDACPEYIDCEPPTDCSAQIAECPFSKIAG